MTLINERYGIAILGDYVVSVNQWNDQSLGSQQAIETTDTGFKVVAPPASVPTNGAPASYSSIYYGAHWSRRSPRTLLPVNTDTDFFQNMQVTLEWVEPE